MGSDRETRLARSSRLKTACSTGPGACRITGRSRRRLHVELPLKSKPQRVNVTKTFWIVCVFCAGSTFAQSVDKEPVAIVELGGAPGWSLKDPGWSLGPTVAVEVTPIENWLE